MMCLPAGWGLIAPAGGSIPAFWGMTSWLTNGSASSGSARYGWTFTVIGGADIVCSKLRANTSASGTERVIVHRNSDSAVMAQADILTPGSDVWGVASVTPFTLVNGVSYTVSTCRAPAVNRSFRVGNTATFDSRLGSISGVNGIGDGRPTGADATFRRFCDFGA